MKQLEMIKKGSTYGEPEYEDNQVMMTQEEIASLGEPAPEPEPQVPIIPPVPDAPTTQDTQDAPVEPITTSQTTTTSVQTKPTAREGQLQKQADQLFKDQQKLVQSSQKFAETEAQIAIDQVREKQKAFDQYQVERQQTQRQFEEQLQGAKATLAEERQKFKEMKITDMFEGKPGQKILAAISIGLGAVASSMSGQPNYALNIINDAVENNFAKQKAMIAKQKEVISQAGRMTTEIQDAFDKKLIQLDNNRAAAYEKIQDTVAEKSALLHKDKIPAQTQQLLNDLEMKKNQADMQAEQSLRSKIQTQVVEKQELPSTEDTYKKYGNIDKLRAEYNKHPVVAAAKEGDRAFAQLKSNLDRKTKAGDLAAIFSFMKSLDPRSVVREGEQLQVQRTDGIFGTVQAYVSQINDEGTLTQDSRDDLRETIKASIEASKRELPTIQKQQFEPILQQRGFDRTQVFGAEQPAKQEESSQGPHGNQVRQNGKLYIWDGKQYVEQ